MKVLRSDTSLATPLYGVVTDGIRIDTVDLNHPEQNINKLTKQNHRILHKYEIK